MEVRLGVSELTGRSQLPSGEVLSGFTKRTLDGHGDVVVAAFDGHGRARSYLRFDGTGCVHERGEVSATAVVVVDCHTGGTDGRGRILVLGKPAHQELRLLLDLSCNMTGASFHGGKLWLTSMPQRTANEPDAEVSLSFLGHDLLADGALPPSCRDNLS